MYCSGVPDVYSNVRLTTGDAPPHCGKTREALADIAPRLGAWGLELHLGKAKIVYCKDGNRR